MTNVEEEADETLFWLELLVDTDTVPRRTVATLMDEAEQLLRIVVASITTARGGSRRTAVRNPQILNPQSAIRNLQSIRNPQSDIRNTAGPHFAATVQPIT